MIELKEVVLCKQLGMCVMVRQQRFLRSANSLTLGLARGRCGCGYTLAACRTYDPTCPESGPVAEALRDSILAGHVRSAEGLRARPGAADVGHP